MSLPTDDVFIRLILGDPAMTNVEIARKYNVSRERVRQKREALGLPSARTVAHADKTIQKARHNDFGNQMCIICGHPMKIWRIERGWMTCSTKCSQHWRKLPGPVRQRRREKHLQ